MAEEIKELEKEDNIIPDTEEDSIDISEIKVDVGDEETKVVMSDNPADKKPDTDKEPENSETKDEKFFKEKQDKVQKRINKVIAQKGAATRRAEKLEGELEKERKEKLELKKQLAEKTLANDPRPKLDDFPDEEEYSDALADWKIKQRDSKLESERLKKELDIPQPDKKKQEPQDNSQVDENLSKAIAKGQKVHKDFDEVTKDIMYSNTALTFIAESDVAPQMLYYLAQNLDINDDIIGMNPVAATKKLMEIQSQFTNNKKTTNAPAVIEPVSGKAKPTKELKDMSPAEIQKYVDEQEANERYAY